MQNAEPQSHASIYDLAGSLPASSDAQALHRIFSFSLGRAQCRVSRELSSKYGESAYSVLETAACRPASQTRVLLLPTGLPQDNSQLVLSVTDRVLGAQAWFNAERGRKPQTFAGVAAGELEDPTDSGATCDFCRWQTMTAEDTFGRCMAVSLSCERKIMQDRRMYEPGHHSPACKVGVKFPTRMSLPS